MTVSNFSLVEWGNSFSTLVSSYVVLVLVKRAPNVIAVWQVWVYMRSRRGWEWIYDVWSVFIFPSESGWCL